MPVDLNKLSIHQNRAANRFEVPLDDKLALINYVQTDHVYEFTHTEVPPEYSGQHVADWMTQQAFALVQAEGAQVVPSCPFTKSYVKRHPEYQVLMA